MKIFITGATGFVGRQLSNFLLQKGYRVTAVGTRKHMESTRHEKLLYVSADTTQKGPWQKELNDCDAVVNLAGRSIFKRWTKRYRTLIYDSRILTTRNLVDAIPRNKGIIFCSTSASGFYGNGGDGVLTEASVSGDDFLAQVAVDWESEALRAEEKGARVVLSRFGVVLGKHGGMMQKVIPAFRFYAGGPLGRGTQWFPWIHMDDLLAALLFALETADIQGPLNFCSPNPVRNRDFAKTLGRVMKRPAFMPAPAFLLRIVMGELATTVLCSQRMVPEKLLTHGFRFQYPDIKDALSNIMNI